MESGLTKADASLYGVTTPETIAAWLAARQSQRGRRPTFIAGRFIKKSQPRFEEGCGSFALGVRVDEGGQRGEGRRLREILKTYTENRDGQGGGGGREIFSTYTHREKRNRSSKRDRPTNTHSRHTQSVTHTRRPHEPSKAGAARPVRPTKSSGPHACRTRDRDPPSEQASEHVNTTDHQPVLQPAPHRPRGPRAGRIPTPALLFHVFSLPAGRPQSRSSARPRKRGRTPGARATPTHTAHSPTPTQSV